MLTHRSAAWGERDDDPASDDDDAESDVPSGSESALEPGAHGQNARCVVPGS